MSVYLVGPWGWLLQAGYVALAGGITLLAFDLYRVSPAPQRSAAPLLLFVIGAVALVVTALVPMRFRDEDLRPSTWCMALRRKRRFCARRPRWGCRRGGCDTRQNGNDWLPRC